MGNLRMANYDCDDIFRYKRTWTGIFQQSCSLTGSICLRNLGSRMFHRAGLPTWPAWGRSMMWWDSVRSGTLWKRSVFSVWDSNKPEGTSTCTHFIVAVENFWIEKVGFVLPTLKESKYQLNMIQTADTRLIHSKTTPWDFEGPWFYPCLAFL